MENVKGFTQEKSNLVLDIKSVFRPDAFILNTRTSYLLSYRFMSKLWRMGVRTYKRNSNDKHLICRRDFATG